MKRIMILHPEGNININPNLTGIVEILCNQGYGVDIYSRHRDFHTQDAPCPGVNMYKTDLVDPLYIAILSPASRSQKKPLPGLKGRSVNMIW